MRQQLPVSNESRLPFRDPVSKRSSQRFLPNCKDSRTRFTVPKVKVFQRGRRKQGKKDGMRASRRSVTWAPRKLFGDKERRGRQLSPMNPRTWSHWTVMAKICRLKVQPTSQSVKQPASHPTNPTQPNPTQPNPTQPNPTKPNQTKPTNSATHHPTMASRTTRSSRKENQPESTDFHSKYLHGPDPAKPTHHNHGRMSLCPLYSCGRHRSRGPARVPGLQRGGVSALQQRGGLPALRPRHL